MYLNKTTGSLNPRGGQPQSTLQTTTVRQFDGGLNVVDTDLNMAPKYARILDNLERATDGSLSLRPGTRLLSSQMWDTTPIINHVYFNGFIIVVQNSGAFTQIDGTGKGTNMPLIVTGAKPWGDTTPVTYCSFTIFNSDLICCDGSHKPIIVKGNPSDPNYMKAQYLVDEASGSNVNTPVGKYVVIHDQYLLIAGLSGAPSTVAISAKGTSGTFFGDAAPNDAVDLDLGPRVSLGSSTITGMVAYRDKLLVTFERGVLPVNLGIYSGSPSVHTPSDDGFIEEYGCLCHRSLISVGDDTFFNDNVGVNSINRINIFYTLRPLRASHLIDPMTTAAIQPLSAAQIEQYMFAVYDLRNFRYMLFVPVFDAQNNLIETVGFSYTDLPMLKIQAWARLRGWKWQSACRTSLQNIIFSMGHSLYAYDFDNPNVSMDFQGDPNYNSGDGVAITFDWEMPWTDLHHRMNMKQTRYIGMDTLGTAPFTVRAYVDHIYNYQGTDSPLLSMDFDAGDVGLTAPPVMQTGRTTADERLYAFPAKFNILKLRFSGTVTTPVRFVSVSLSYLSGTIRR